MNDIATVLTFLAVAYFAGGIPFGYLIGRMRGVDIRTVGSKNIGATNVFRTVGKSWGLMAFVCDMLKGLLPTLAAKLFSGIGWLPLVTGVVCVLGHMLTPYITNEAGKRFRGGKGVATAFGMLIALIPALVGLAFALFVLVFACSNYISLGSCTAAAFLAVSVWIPACGQSGYRDLPQCLLVTLIALFVIYKHRSNISRLAKGTENKIYFFRNGKR